MSHINAPAWVYMDMQKHKKLYQVGFSLDH
ncbi:hypothetical protein LSAT2_014816, partial [Lamellibrachia satsuma]